MPSAVIKDFEYDAGMCTLRIEFVSGYVYDYYDVPVQVYDRMRSSFSKGSFFNEHIKGRYAFQILNEEEVY